MNNNLYDLYIDSSKHSGYQILHPKVASLLPNNVIQGINRFEKERCEYILKHIDFKNKNVLDIGGNTGYFSLEANVNGALSVIHYEGNKSHSDFVKEVSSLLCLNVKTTNNYFLFSETTKTDSVDVVLLLNVVHHLGDDFGDQTISLDNAKIEMANSINYFVGKTDYLVLQMGYCWKGDRNNLLFQDGTKLEMIEFVKNAVRDKWEIVGVGIAEVDNGKTIYNEMSNINIVRNDELGEFRNRPLIILKIK